MKRAGAEAERPISTGRRGLVCSDFFGFGAVAGTDFEPFGKTEAVGVSTTFSPRGRGFGPTVLPVRLALMS